MKVFCASTLILAGAGVASGTVHRLGGEDRQALLAKRQQQAATATSTRQIATATATRPPVTTTPTAASGPRGSVPMSPLAALSSIGVTTTAEQTQPLPTTFSAGATPPVSGAPPLPAITALNPANYPALDRIPPTDSPEVREWLSRIDMSQIPPISPNGLNLCANTTYNAEAIRNRGADANCWWSCGGCTAPSDITVCPTRNDWGVSFDDGPSPYTPRLLNMLNQYDIKATFFVVGSRVISRPQMLQTEYMMGHQISIHTWSHHPLTTLTNEEIVAELGWTQKVIKDVIGVAPNTMRAPFGDVDNRVRAIANQMGLTNIIWSSTRDGRNFDTEDWKIGAGTVTAPQVFQRFESFMQEAVQTLSTGFIVLAHDLYQQSVDLAMGYILPAALNGGQLSLKPISTCQGRPLAAAYVETSNEQVRSERFTGVSVSRPSTFSSTAPSTAIVTVTTTGSRPATTGQGEVAANQNNAGSAFAISAMVVVVGTLAQLVLS